MAVDLQDRTRALGSGTKETFARFFAADPFTLAAAISFYALLSLAPLVMIVLAIAGFVWGQRAARGELLDQIETFAGPDGAAAVQAVIANAAAPGAGGVSMLVGVIVLLIGATTVLAQLNTSLNRMWNLEPRRESAGLASTVRTRLKALGVVILIGALLLLSITGSGVLSAMHGYLNELTWGLGWFWQIVHFLISVALLGVLVAMVFKYLPDAQVDWRVVRVGATITAVLLVIGQFAIGIYLSQAGVGTAYGAAGSVVVLVVWVYYSVLVLLLGAQITEVYARRSGRAIEPAAHATARPDPLARKEAA